MFDPSDIFESNISDKDLACTERFAKRAARVEKVCKKLTEDGSPFKDILLSSPVNIDGNVYIRSLANIIMPFYIVFFFDYDMLIALLTILGLIQPSEKRHGLHSPQDWISDLEILFPKTQRER